MRLNQNWLAMTFPTMRVDRAFHLDDLAQWLAGHCDYAMEQAAAPRVLMEAL